MKIILRTLPIGLLAINFAHSQNFTQKQIETLNTKKQFSYEDLSHENPGCPENSICSKEMGIKMKSWNKFIMSLKKESTPGRKLEAFRKKHGIPVTFLTTKESSLSIDPIFFHTRCQKHKSKEAEQVIYKGTQFFRNNPNTKFAMFDKVEVLNEGQSSTFELPYEELPILIKDKMLIVPRDYDNVYYHLGVDKKGKWKIITPKKSDIAKALQTMDSIDCPTKEKEYFCKSIWNADTRKAQIIKLAWKCN